VRTLARRAGLALLGLASFVLVATSLGGRAPLPHETWLRVKRDRLAEGRDEYDAVFVGSSIVQSGIDVRAFDAVLAAAGHEQRSFSFSLPLMTFEEAIFWTRELLADPPPRLRRVFLELLPFNTSVFQKHDEAERMRHWHDWEATRTACWSLFWRHGNVPLRVRMTLWHLRLFASRAVGLGDAVQALRAGHRLPDADEPYYHRLVARGAGYVALEDHLEEGLAERHREFREDPSELRARLEEMERRPPPSEVVDAYQVAVLQRLAADAEAAGVELVLVLMPMLEWQRHILRAEKLGLLPVVLDANDPHAYPALYRARQRYDLGHLSREGAALCTSILAEQLVEHLAARDGG